MKSVKTFIIIGCVLLCGAVAAGVYVWFAFQEYQKDLKNPPELLRTESSVAVPKNVVE